MNRSRTIGVVVVLALAAVPVGADGLFRDIFHGLDLAVTPSGSPVTTLANGLRVNGARTGRVRVVPNRLGDGYRLELDRTFGADDTGRPEIFDAGPYELQLDGSIQSTLGFTRRNFFGNDHTHNSFFIGSGNIGIANLNYELRETSGAQDITLRGTLNASGRIEVNQLGFYTLSLNVSNTNSELEMDGVVVGGDTDTDYDIGPINVKGNVFFDVVVASLAALGVDTSALEKVFPNSPIDAITRNIRDSLAGQMGVLGEDAAAKSLATASLLPGDGVGPVPSFGHLLAVDPLATAQGPAGVPEPASIALVLLGLAAVGRAARRG